MSSESGGFVVACASRSIPGLTTWWYGPKHGWGTTSGARTDPTVATFTSRNAAENALKSVYGTLATAKRRGYRVVKAGAVAGSFGGGGMSAATVVSMNVGSDLEGRIAYLPSPTGRTERRVRVEAVERIGPGVDGSGGFRVVGTWLRAATDDRRGAYCQSMIGSRVVEVEIASVSVEGSP